MTATVVSAGGAGSDSSTSLISGTRVERLARWASNPRRVERWLGELKIPWPNEETDASAEPEVGECCKNWGANESPVDETSWETSSPELEPE